MSRALSPEKERRILRAAEGLFSARPFHEVRMDDISREAGVGKGTIYRYYSNKQALFQRLMESGMTDLLQIVSGTAESECPFRDRLKRVVGDISRSFARRKPLLRMLHGDHARMATTRAEFRQRFKAHKEKLRKVVCDLVASGVRTGEIRSDISAETIADAILGMLKGQFWQKQTISRRKQEEIVTILIDGARADSRRKMRGAKT